MATYSPLIAGVFQSESDAKNALDALRQAGFDHDQIGLALREGGVVTKNLLNDLVKLGVPQERANYYNSEYLAGHPILSVRADGREQEAAEILRNYGAYDYQGQASNAAATYTDQNVNNDSSTYTDRDSNYAPAYTDQAAGTTSDREERRIPVREEVLNAEKERVQTGEARVRKDVVEEERSINVPVTHEEVYVERRPVEGGRVSDTPIGEDETIRVPVSEEQVNVTKTPVQTGEVAIGKRAVEENREVRDTIRREEPRVEQDGNPAIRTNDDIVNP